MLQEQPRTGLVTMQTQLMLWHQGQGEVEGQGLAFIPSLSCTVASNVIESLYMIRAAAKGGARRLQ